MTWIVAYDISDETVRAHVAHVLEQFGERVQKSVFECRLDKRTLDLLTRKLGTVLEDPSHGNIRVYRACADCLALSFGIGPTATTTSSRPSTVI